MIEVVSPPLHHFRPFVPMLSPRVSCTDSITLDVSKLTLNCVGVPSARFVQQARRSGAEAVSCYFVLCIPKTPESSVQGPIRNGARWRTNTRKQQISWCDRPEDGEQCHSLSRQRHVMGSPHLHPGRGNGPNRPLKIELGPLGQPQFTWPGKQECEQSQSDSCARLPVE